MGDSLTLDDGRTLVRSSMGVSGTLLLTAKQIPDALAEFGRWLIDVSERPNGFASLDLRGLPEDLRAAFHLAARSAWQELSEREGIAESGSHTYHVMADLISMLDSISRGEPPETPPSDSVCVGEVILENITEIWNDDAG